MRINAFILILMMMALVMGMIFTFAACAGKKENAKVEEIKVTDVYRKLRNQVFTISPQDIGIELKSKTQPWGILMEFGLPGAVVTLVTFGSGEASMYFSSGGGVLGGGEHETVRKAAKAFVAFSETYLEKMKPGSTYPLPKDGNVKFLVLTGKGVFSSQEFLETDLRENKSKFSPLFHKGHQLITELRLISERMEREGSTK
ncbi:MAG: hypothetical protein GTO45_36710 [Candidatus Aminicenantes bacterium]|nr:hypothetical protein [Candidatus Aminicenantes bacterium]NIM84245.1 hypothetical protein [Candidatus Aminicenantes bacterium]NIN23694.1 hypothetical protein [Candidatus Aminicenantes bacterium]NIN47401.1 hypothetical protein [Candidatus Aminicenantes bacterium]NIN90329.1 hypothetical protein [Candidatus Aminicenantes bacterium]